VATRITRDVLESYLHCPYKAHLKLTGARGRPTDYEILQGAARIRAQRAAADRLIGRHEGGEVPQDVAIARPLLKRGLPLLVGGTVEDHVVSIRFDALLREAGASRLGEFHYTPAMFHEAERPRDEQTALLGLFGVILGGLQGRPPSTGLLVHGPRCAIRRINLDAGRPGAQRVLQEIKEMQGSEAPPPRLLNSHCPVCEFRDRCRAEPTAADDLSLLGGLGPKEIRKYNRRGIFTVTQLSCTFRPPRKRKGASPRSRPRQPALQALAIRDRRVYVLGTPHAPDAPNRIYFDIEGDPDRRFAYLIGVIVERDGREERHSLWADNPGEERRLFQELLAVVGPPGDSRLYAYGSYDAAFLRRMIKEADPDELGAKLLPRVVNVLSIVHAHVYLPTYSNSLKDVGRYLGFDWTAPDASALQSIVWRREWEASGAASLKETLTTYNLEDCAALRGVTEFVRRLCPDRPDAPSPGEPLADRQVTRVDEMVLPSTRPQFGRPEFAIPDFALIYKQSYFDYQRDRVFLRANKAVKARISRKRSREAKRNLPVNRTVVLTSPECPQCGGTDVTRRPHGRLARLAYDLRFTPSGIRRWVTRFTTDWHFCRGCERRFLPRDYLRLDAHFHSLKSWAMNEYVTSQASFAQVAEKLNGYFGIPVDQADVHTFKTLLAHYYAGTYQRLLDKIASGAIVHADETGVRVRGEPKGYVWVFTNQEEVIFMYRPSREGGYLHDLLKDFHGVLISDFYAAYDSLPCPQQKCHTHLIRDINNDIQANPWDEELKGLAADYGHLLRTILATVDQYGLRKRHLGKHRREVHRFFRAIEGRTYRSEVANGFRRRFLEYEEKLFTFLDHDGVPWNNNNAEHAVKSFALYRDVADGTFTEDGLKDYLVLLSICLTCKYKEVSFLRFLLSLEKDLDAFCASMSRRRPRPTIELCPEGFTDARRYPPGRFALKGPKVRPLGRPEAD
jgi:predicted RecB family nuclease